MTNYRIFHGGVDMRILERIADLARPNRQDSLSLDHHERTFAEDELERERGRRQERRTMQRGGQRVREVRIRYRIWSGGVEDAPCPVDCRRVDLQIEHIMADGTIETNEQAEKRLMSLLHIVPDMFHSEADRIELAYDKQAGSIAYVINSPHEDIHNRIYK